MPRHLIKRFAPDREAIRTHKHLQVFGKLLHDPNLWHMNRRSVSGSFAVGLFWALVPIPLQMLAAAAMAIFLRVNLPISVALVWLTNPLTIPPIFYCTYLIGAWILDSPPLPGHFQMSMEWFTSSMSQIWEPLVLGSLLCALAAALIGFVSIRLLWRLHIIQHLKRRRLKRQQTQG